MGRRLRHQAPVTGKIRSLRNDGRGRMLVEGTEYLVEDALPGEEVVADPFGKSRSRVEARVQTVLVPSADRVTPRCEAYGDCGGCRLQHMDSKAQLAWKQDLLLDDLGARGVLFERLLAPITSSPWNYRRRARLGVKSVPAKGRVLVGFRERGKPYICDCRRCEILDGPAGGLLESLSELVGRLDISAALPQVEMAHADNATAMVFRVLEPPSSQDLVEFEKFSRDQDVQVFLQSGGLETVTPLHADQPGLFYRLPDFDLEMVFRPTDFVQVNAEVNRAMVSRAIELLECRADSRVLDLFCGMGNFSLALGRRAGQVTGVDSDPGLIARAGLNAERNGLDNVLFEQGDLYQEPVTGDWLKGRFDRVLLDPPRAGAAQVLQHLPALGARRLVYVSCGPDSFVQDAAVLTGSLGYRLEAVGVMDMFPHTLHVETMGLFVMD
ncbi:MAG: 23S rRNA (uracil(1939)-C(5))-methyltransferase RlmD [Gammaproteobacteria bacterium]|nr:23S rRNA (uracil(1939)-C(5))-methyltransferase RlmD [Gammaproteobacteria bacterium]